MNTYQKKYIRNWFIAIFTIAFIAINVWALITGVVAVKIIWAGVLVILGGWCLAACVYGFIVLADKAMYACKNIRKTDLNCKYVVYEED